MRFDRSISVPLGVWGCVLAGLVTGGCIMLPIPVADGTDGVQNPVSPSTGGDGGQSQQAEQSGGSTGSQRDPTDHATTPAVGDLQGVWELTDAATGELLGRFRFDEAGQLREFCDLVELRDYDVRRVAVNGQSQDAGNGLSTWASAYTTKADGQITIGLVLTVDAGVFEAARLFAVVYAERDGLDSASGWIAVRYVLLGDERTMNFAVQAVRVAVDGDVCPLAAQNAR